MTLFKETLGLNFACVEDEIVILRYIIPMWRSIDLVFLIELFVVILFCRFRTRHAGRNNRIYFLGVFNVLFLFLLEHILLLNRLIGFIDRI